MNHCSNPSKLKGDPFNLVRFTIQDVHQACLKMQLTLWHSITIIFNLSIENKEVPSTWKSAFVLRLWKGGDPAVLNNYRPISNVCILAKPLECVVCDQLMFALRWHPVQMSDRSTGPSHQDHPISSEGGNCITVAVDTKQFCAFLFIDLSEAFDPVDHAVLKSRLLC